MQQGYAMPNIDIALHITKYKFIISCITVEYIKYFDPKNISSKKQLYFKKD